MALRDEINSLLKALRQNQNSSPKNKISKSSNFVEGDVSHPLSDHDDSGITENEELEKIEKINKNLILENEQRGIAIKELENIIRNLRTEKDQHVKG